MEWEGRQLVENQIWSLSQRGERIREGKILFVVAADSLPGKFYAEAIIFSSALRASEARHDQAEMKYRSDCYLLKCSSENLNQSTNLH